LLLTLACAAQAADTPKPDGFMWRASLSLPAGASLARIALPPQALAVLQTTDAHDLRVFNAAGEAVAFSLAGESASPVQLAPQFTSRYAALPLFAATSGKAPAKGAVQVRVDTAAGNAQSVWVQLNPGGNATTANPPTAQNQSLPSALFDTRQENQTVTALSVQAELPANAPVQLRAAISSDLAQWTPLALRGSLFRFDGPGAPANDTLELEQPLNLQGRYLRLDWAGFDGVHVSGVSGRIAQARPQLVRPQWSLPAGTAQGSTALEWTLPFATPVAALALTSSAANTLVPVRVLGRSEAGQPWRALAQGVVYRLGADGSAQALSPSLPLGHASVRWLRVEATNGMALPTTGLQAAVAFEPLQLVFVASGNGPFELAVGRAETPQAAVPLAMLTAGAGGRLDNIALATVATVLAAGAQPPSTGLGGLATRSNLLWAVLLLGVVVLGAVAWSLFRQLKKPAPPA
jgi:hypothetical protein